MDQLLTDRNFIIYAAQNYANPACTGTDEFYEDIRKIKYIKKLLTRFLETGALKERLILNHVVVLGNVFNPNALNRILFLKMEPQFGLIKPFLLMLGLLQENIINVKETRVVKTERIVMNPIIINKLREILPDKRVDID